MANLEYSLLPHTCISLKNSLEELDIIKTIGCGTYGEVFRAEFKATKELVALKTIKMNAGEDFNSVQQEVAILSECRHENIVGYYGSCFKNGKLFIAVEYCGGGSLPEIYRKHGPLPEDTIAFTSRETLKGLEYLHRSKVMHRDIKGANLLLTLEGDVKISDFAISAALTATLKSKSIVGTPYWMAPEVASADKKGGYTFQCDIWAVGITAIELAETQPPLFDLHPMTALLMMTKKSFKPENLKDAKRWSKEFQLFIKHLLVKNPTKRPTASQALSHSFLHRSTARKESIKPLLKYHTLPKPKQIVVPTFDSDEEEEVKTMTVAAPKKEDEHYSIQEILYNLTDPIERQHVPVPDRLVLKDQGEQSWLEENPLPVIPPRITQKGKNADVIPIDTFSAQKEPTYEHFPDNMVIYGLRPRYIIIGKPGTPSTREGTSKHLVQVLATSNKDQAIYGHFKNRIGDNLSREIDNNSSSQPPPIPPRSTSSPTKKLPDRTRLGVLNDCKADKDFVLSFHSEDGVKSLEILSDDGWCIIRNLESSQKGLAHNKYVASLERMEKEQGVIPSNYAQKIDSSFKIQQEDGQYLILGLPPEMENWKIEGSNLELIDEIAKGNFGIAFQGILKKKGSSGQLVTVKKCISGSITDQKQLLREANKLKLLIHPNIVEFIGVSMHDGGICIILEQMPGGDFQTFLRNKAMNEKKHVLSEMVLDVSKGMSYLASKDCVHRNLIASNCVISENRSVKIGSFRMARFQHELDEERKLSTSETLPLKWTAPEALNDRLFTCQSDVWSYGILMWETFSYGSIPYPEMNNKTAIEKIHTGYRPLASEGTPPDIYLLMQNCWEYQPQDRPQFPKIVQSLESITQKLQKKNI